MESVLFYTFSTIAATFGSAVGIIVAAAIFRMQKIDKIAADLATELMKYHPNEAEKTRLNRIILVQDWSKFLLVWREYHPVGNAENPFEEAHRYLLDRASARLDRIRSLVRGLVIGTLFVIGGCFVGLAAALCIMDGFVFCGTRGVNLPVLVALSDCPISRF